MHIPVPLTGIRNTGSFSIRSTTVQTKRIRVCVTTYWPVHRSIEVDAVPHPETTSLSHEKRLRNKKGRSQLPDRPDNPIQDSAQFGRNGFPVVRSYISFRALSCSAGLILRIQLLSESS